MWHNQTQAMKGPLDQPTLLPTMGITKTRPEGRVCTPRRQRPFSA